MLFEIDLIPRVKYPETDYQLVFFRNSYDGLYSDVMTSNKVDIETEETFYVTITVIKELHTFWCFHVGALKGSENQSHYRKFPTQKKLEQAVKFDKILILEQKLIPVSNDGRLCTIVRYHLIQMEAFVKHFGLEGEVTSG